MMGSKVDKPFLTLMKILNVAETFESNIPHEEALRRNDPIV